MVFFLCNTRCPLFALFRPRACPWYAANQLQRKRINNNNSFGTDGSNSRSIRGSSRLLVGNIVPSVGLWFFLRSPTLFWRESWWEKGVFFFLFGHCRHRTYDRSISRNQPSSTFGPLYKRTGHFNATTATVSTKTANTSLNEWWTIKEGKWQPTMHWKRTVTRSSYYVGRRLIRDGW